MKAFRMITFRGYTDFNTYEAAIKAGRESGEQWFKISNPNYEVEELFCKTGNEYGIAAVYRI